jgi:hypothetical protein
MLRDHMVLLSELRHSVALRGVTRSYITLRYVSILRVLRACHVKTFGCDIMAWRRVVWKCKAWTCIAWAPVGTHGMHAPA